LGLTVYRKVSGGFQKSINIGTSGFLKLFNDCTGILGKSAQEFASYLIVAVIKNILNFSGTKK
jgi:hypothetical protein